MISRTKRNRIINNIDDTDVSILAHKKKNKTRINFIFLFGIFFFSLSASVSLGAVDISLESIFAIFLDRIGIASSLDYSKQHEMVILGIRLPRTILGILVGAALAASGAALQGIFRNPLADPALIGVSTGAALAAVSVIVLGGNILLFNDANWTPFIIPLAAFVGGIISTFIVSGNLIDTQQIIDKLKAKINSKFFGVVLASSVLVSYRFHCKRQQQ